MRYGYFDDERREYVVTRPDTPLPWINYPGVDEYCGLISKTAGGYSFCRDPRERRILRYRHNNVPADRPGRYLYLRDDATGKYWSAAWAPVQQPQPDGTFECRHGLSRTTIRTSHKGIRSETTYLVPPDERAEVWRLRVRNTGRNARRLSVFSYAEFCLWDAVDENGNYAPDFGVEGVWVCNDQNVDLTRGVYGTPFDALKFSFNAPELSFKASLSYSALEH